MPCSQRAAGEGLISPEARKVAFQPQLPAGVRSVTGTPSQYAAQTDVTGAGASMWLAQQHKVRWG